MFKGGHDHNQHRGALPKEEVVAASGNAIKDNDDNWQVDCPACGKNYEYEGFYDPGDKTNCSCGAVFRIKRVYFENGDYMGDP